MYFFINKIRYIITLRKPQLFFRLFFIYLSVLFLRKQLLRYVVVSVGYACNFKCNHCFTSELQRRFPKGAKRALTFAGYARLAQAAMQLGAVSFSFQGGEPTLCKDLIQIIKQFQPKQNSISLITNGSITKKQVMDLKRNGVDTISFSIDSHDLSEHDIFRKKRGAAQRAWEMLFFAQRHGVRVNISTTVSHQNIDSHGLTELIKYTRKISAGLVLVPAVPMGRWAKNAAVCLTGRDFQKIEKYVRENRHVMTDYEYNYHHRGCGAVKEILYVSPYGDILPCPFIPFSLGNVQEESLACIRERALHLKCFNTYEKNCLAARNPGFVRKLSK